MRSIALAALLAAAAVAPAHALPESAPPAASTAAQGPVAPTTDVADPVFGVHEKVLGLERSVEMLQWRKVDLPPPAHYEKAWSAERIDSSGFDAKHRNTVEFPFNGERWWSADAKLDGHPVSNDVLAKFDAWETLQPDLSQLPPNLAASFQPDPDGQWLSTSQDPAHPRVGDLRVRWRKIAAQPAPAGIALVDGQWKIAPQEASTAAAESPQAPIPSPLIDTREPAVPGWFAQLVANPLVWFAGAGVIVLMLGWSLGRRSRAGGGGAAAPKRKPGSKPKKR